MFRLPTICPYRTFVDGGGLMAYGTDTGEVFRQSARSIVSANEAEDAGSRAEAIAVGLRQRYDLET
jgi:hypothetical protein